MRIYHDKLFLASNSRVTWHDREGAVLNWFYPSVADMDIQA
jgi:hypothetical protein